MLYIKNVSAKLIHIGSVMLKPDEKIADEVSVDKNEMENVHAANYSDIPAVKAMIRMGLLELVDVVYRQKESEPQIHREYIDVDELPEEEKKKEAPAPKKEEPKKEDVVLSIETDNEESVQVQNEEKEAAPKKKSAPRKSGKSKAKEAETNE